MTYHPAYRIRTAVVTIGAVMSVIALSADRAFAEYHAWFGPWDFVGDFQQGDVSDGYTEMVPPPTACGLRITDPSYYRWKDDYGNTVASADLYKDVIIWIDNPGSCSHAFSVEYHDGSNTFSPPAGGAVSMAISTNYAVHWVNDNGYYLYTCGGCAGADDLVLGPPEVIWPLVTVSGFKAVSQSLDDPRRQPGAVSAVAELSLEVAGLQTLLQKRLTSRRRTSLGDLESGVRALEDGAARRLAAARASAGVCETLARQTRYADAFAACTAAGQAVEDSESLMRTAWFLSHPPSKDAMATK